MKIKKKALWSLLTGLLTLALSLTIFFHISSRMRREHEVEVRLTLTLSSLSPEICDALCSEGEFLLDGRFPLAVSNFSLTPSLLRFYDFTKRCEFTIPSARKKDATLELTSKARSHPFGYALGGIRTVNVGMNVTLYGKRCKAFGRIDTIDVL